MRNCPSLPQIGFMLKYAQQLVSLSMHLISTTEGIASVGKSPEQWRSDVPRGPRE